MAEALDRGHPAAYFRALTAATLYLPQSQDGDLQRMLTCRSGQDTFLLTFTSPEAIRARLTGIVNSTAVRYTQLVTQWPNPAWRMAVDPGLPIEVYLAVDGVPQVLDGAQGIANATARAIAVTAGVAARAAAMDDRSMADPVALVAGPEGLREPKLMCKIVPPEQVDHYLLYRRSQISGPVFVWGSAVGRWLARARRQVHLLRWSGYCPAVYPPVRHDGDPFEAVGLVSELDVAAGYSPQDQSTDLGMFTGIGRLDMRWVNAVVLPHGSQLVRIEAGGVENLLAGYDADLDLWVRP